LRKKGKLQTTEYNAYEEEARQVELHL